MFMYVGTAAGVAAKQVVDKTAATVQDVNVAEVQNILTTEFHQLIHLPKPQPPTPAPADSPLYYNVSGAGLAEWNGQYARAHDESQMGLQYLSTNPACSRCALYSNGDMWRLAISGVEVYYVASAASALPPTAANGWEVGQGGKAPAPMLVAGPV
jgi:hypothetical protein